MLLGAGLALGAQRSVLLELFTSEDCPYCPSASLAGDSLKKLYGDTLTVVNYVYGSSTGEYAARFNYYGVQYVPTGWVDGVLSYTGGSPFDEYRSMIEQRKGVPSPVRIENLTAQRSGDSGYVSLRVVLEEDLNPSDSPRIFVAVTQRNVVAYYNNTVTDRLFVDMVTLSTGEPLTVFSAGQSQDYSGGFRISPIWEGDTLDVAAWVQYYETKEVLQAAQTFAFTVDVSEGKLGANPSVRWADGKLLLAGEGPYALRVFDPAGRLLWARKGVLEGEGEVSLAGLPKGVYVAVLELGGKRLTALGLK